MKLFKNVLLGLVLSATISPAYAGGIIGDAIERGRRSIEVESGRAGETLDPGRYIRSEHQIHFKNKCHKTVYVALKYYNDSSGKSHVNGYRIDWPISYWYKLSPGQSKHLLNTDNRYSYWYAEDRNGTMKWSGSSSRGRVGEKTVGFNMIDAGGNYGKFTQSLSCN